MKNHKEHNQHAFLLLEFLVYLVLAALVLYSASAFIVNSVSFNQHLERAITSECALHNACILFKRDQLRMPRKRLSYTHLQTDKIAFTDTQGNLISWYFDKERLMRASSNKTGEATKTNFEHAVVLAPVYGAFSAQMAADQVFAILLELSHNDKQKSIKLWLNL